MPNKVFRAPDLFLRHPGTFRILLAAAIITMSSISPAPMLIKAVIAVIATGLLIVRQKNLSSPSPTTALAICFATGIWIITVCSKSSFLYPFNDWVDANCFFTVGKCMMNGIVPYRDLLEQKGPFLYFLHGIAWLISQDTFIGVYLIEILSATFFLFYTYRTARLFTNCIYTVLIIPISALMVYTSKSFSHGDSVEELSLPLLAYAMWLGMRAVCGKRNISGKEFFLIGVTSGLIFWSKFTLVGYYVGWYLFLAAGYARNGRWKQIASSAFAIFLGVVASTVPFVFYFGYHGAIRDWLTVYLYNNLFLYSQTATQITFLPIWMVNILRGIRYVFHKSPFLLLCFLPGFLQILYKHPKAGFLFLITFGFTFSFAFVGGRYIPYYVFILALFVPYALIPLLELTEKLCQKQLPTTVTGGFLAIVMTLCLVLSLRLSPNRYLMGAQREELPQYVFASIIGTDGSATLLNYGFLDGGFYTVSNIFPNCKAFCKLNITPDQMEAMQDAYLEQGLVDYVVARDEPLEADNYEFVSFRLFYFEGVERGYYLYRLKN